MKTKRLGFRRPGETRVSRRLEWSAISNTAGSPARWALRTDHWIYTFHDTGGAAGVEIWMGQLRKEWEAMFTAALFTVAESQKQPKCPSTEEWIKMWHIYAMEYYSALKKKGILPFAATWMDLEILILSEVSQTEKNKYCMTSLICEI